MTAGRLAAVLAAALGALPARAYVRTTDDATGRPLAWSMPVVPYLVNPSHPATSDPGRQAASPSCAATAEADPALAAARAGFAAWEQSCSSLRLVFGGTTDVIQTGRGPTTENVVVLRSGWCSQHPQAKDDPCRTDDDVDCGGIYGCFEDSGGPADWSIVALTSVLYDPGSGRIIDADIEVNGWDGEPGAIDTRLHGWYFTCADRVAGQPATICTSYGEAGCLFIDLQSTLTHEAGHFIGLAHPCDGPGAPPCSTNRSAFQVTTMYPTTTAGDVQKRTLSADDVDGVCAIYPASSGDGGCGCGSSGAAGILPLLVVGFALRRRLFGLRPR